jgi:hypothetical protein
MEVRVSAGLLLASIGRQLNLIRLMA